MTDFLPRTAPIEAPPAPDQPGFKRKGRLLTRGGKRLPNANLAPPECPDPERAYHAASLRCIGKSVKDTAEAVGVCPSTISRWEKEPWWAAVRSEAVRTEHGELRAMALGVAQHALEHNDAPMARWILERLEPEVFGPPKVKQEITGKDGAPIQVEAQPLSEDQTREIAEILKSMDAFAHVPFELSKQAEEADGSARRR